VIGLGHGRMLVQQMAGREMLVLRHMDARDFGAAAIHRLRAARVERASWGSPTPWRSAAA
jgi:hypothetical protein